jgi:hypothetical protein
MSNHNIAGYARITGQKSKEKIFAVNSGPAATDGDTSGNGGMTASI